MTPATIGRGARPDWYPWRWNVRWMLWRYRVSDALAARLERR